MRWSFCVCMRVSDEVYKGGNNKNKNNRKTQSFCNRIFVAVNGCIQIGSAAAVARRWRYFNARCRLLTTATTNTTTTTCHLQHATDPHTIFMLRLCTIQVHIYVNIYIYMYVCVYLCYVYKCAVTSQSPVKPLVGP